MRFYRMRAGVLPPALLFALSALAESPLNVPDVVVSATRSEQSDVSLPAQVQVIGRREIQASGARDITELLRNRANVVVSDLYGDGSRTSH